MNAPRSVLVTGASRGVGRAVVERLQAEGRAVCALGRDAGALSALDASETVRADLLTEAGLARACEAAREVDAMVLAAGIAEHAPIASVDDDALERAMRLHFRAPLRMIQAFASVAERGGSIVAVSSTLARRAAKDTVAYAASKAALERLVETAALELAERGVRINAVAPGLVETAMIAGRSEAERETLRQAHALGRFGTAEEVARAIVFVLDTPWMTGATLTIDGGLTLG